MLKPERTTNNEVSRRYQPFISYTLQKNQAMEMIDNHLINMKMLILELLHFVISREPCTKNQNLSLPSKYRIAF